MDETLKDHPDWFVPVGPPDGADVPNYEDLLGKRDELYQWLSSNVANEILGSEIEKCVKQRIAFLIAAAERFDRGDRAREILRDLEERVSI